MLADLQASQLDGIVKQSLRPGPIYTELPIDDGGQLTVGPAGIASSGLGTLAFMTPIGEMPLEEVSRAEAEAYRVWREGYQRNWTWFDPIALRISLGKDRLAADLTVMPLVLGSEYRHMGSLAMGGKFSPTAGDPHDTLAQVVLAINRQAPEIRQAENFIAAMGQMATLGWLGDSVSLYAEDDPFWADLAKVKEAALGAFFERNLGRLPLAVRIDVNDPLKLAVFLTSARAFIQQSGPGLTHWEALKYREQPYVRISADARGGLGPGSKPIAIYYAATDGALTVTLSEKLLDRAIDRGLARQKAAADGKPAPDTGKTWLGSTLGLRVDHKILDVINTLSRKEYERTMQTHCWNNLPILNEWKRLYPDRDPVAVHRQVWGVELVCPGGGRYVWNEKFATMESSVYGHPGEPREGPPAPPVLSNFTSGNFGLTLEHEGLRARVVLERGAK